jgi:hypothetical protein
MALSCTTIIIMNNITITKLTCETILQQYTKLRHRKMNPITEISPDNKTPQMAK